MATDSRKRQSCDDGRPWKRIYAPSECLLTSERESGNVYAVGLSNVIAVHALAVPLGILLNDSYKAGRLHLDLEGYYLILGSPWEWLLVAGVLTAEFLLSFLIYFSFLLWAVCYRRVGRLANIVFLLLLVGCVVVARRTVFLLVFDLDFHPAGRVTCCIQQLILCMKWISFIYENANKVVNPWHKDDETGPAVWYAGQMEPQIGSFSSYLYFLFCPVLLYRDRYPRKPANFQRAFPHFISFLMSNLTAFTLFREFLVPHSMHLDDLVTSLLRCMPLGFVLLTLAHTCTIHSWMTMWTYLLGFADQNLYQDWWNGKSLGEYLYKWNPVIQEWLRTYLYSQVKKWLPRVPALLLVLTISAAEHDIIIGTGMGFFLPVYLVEYVFGGFLLLMKPALGKRVDQLIICSVLCLGSGLQISLYCAELVARAHCPSTQPNPAWFDGLRLIECYRRFN